jgi:hypothetical protein
MESHDVAAIYEKMSTLTAHEEKRLYATLSPQMRSALWSLHLRTCLDAGIHFSPEQQQVLRDALDLAGDISFFEIAVGSEAWPAKATRLAAFQEKLLTTFPRKLGAAIFFKLGRPPVTAAEQG